MSVAAKPVHFVIKIWFLTHFECCEMVRFGSRDEYWEGKLGLVLTFPSLIVSWTLWVTFSVCPTSLQSCAHVCLRVKKMSEVATRWSPSCTSTTIYWQWDELRKRESNLNSNVSLGSRKLKSTSLSVELMLKIFWFQLSLRYLRLIGKFFRFMLMSLVLTSSPAYTETEMTHIVNVISRND